MNYEGSGRKRLCIILRYYPSIFLGKTEEKHEKLGKTVRVPAEIRIRHVQNTSQKQHYRLSQMARYI
jgi:hypothetical protein